jgi:hypothetical protein
VLLLNYIPEIIHIPFQTPVHDPRQEYNQTACDVCWDLYGDLNDYYMELDHHGAVCMDIVDAVSTVTVNVIKKTRH